MWVEPGVERVELAIESDFKWVEPVWVAIERVEFDLKVFRWVGLDIGWVEFEWVGVLIWVTIDE